jgi:hypothetical protein
VGSSTVFCVSTGGGGKVAVGVDEDAAQPDTRMAAIHTRNILFIFISANKYT